jgi:hypothetical protein
MPVEKDLEEVVCIKIVELYGSGPGREATLKSGIGAEATCCENRRNIAIFADTYSTQALREDLHHETM